MNCVALIWLFVVCVMDGNESDYRASLDVQAEVPLKTLCNEERETRNRYQRELNCKHRLREEERRSIACNWDITEDEFFKKRNEIKEDDERKRFFNDIEQDPAKQGDFVISFEFWICSIRRNAHDS